MNVEPSATMRKLEPDVCLICGTRNPDSAIQCGVCFAPMAVVHDAIAQEREPEIVSVVGESNVGKTVYLGVLLDMLAQRAGDFKAVPSFSLTKWTPSSGSFRLILRRKPLMVQMEPGVTTEFFAPVVAS